MRIGWYTLISVAGSNLWMKTLLDREIAESQLAKEQVKGFPCTLPFHNLITLLDWNGIDGIVKEKISCLSGMIRPFCSSILGLYELVKRSLDISSTWIPLTRYGYDSETFHTHALTWSCHFHIRRWHTHTTTITPFLSGWWDSRAFIYQVSLCA